MLTLAMLIASLESDPVFVVSVIATVVVSITLHELAHGWAALWQGDRTPIEQGHMTANPLVHMGGFSLLLLVTVGIAYGAMPIEPHRFRSRYGEAMVSAAGPAMNLLLAIIALSGLGLWMAEPGVGSTVEQNVENAVWYFAVTNIALLILNLIPVPPLDGAHILANLSRRYRSMIEQLPPGTTVLVVLGLLVGLSFTDYGLFALAAKAGSWFLALWA
jgi:Zn-dependent protease